MFENGVLRRMFRHKEDDVTGERIRLNNKMLQDLYYTPNIKRVIRSE